MPYVKHHGIELANNATIRNLVIESLASDPVLATAGRAWFNTTSKEWKLSTLDAGGAVIVRTFNTKEAFDTYVSNVASTEAGQGANLVGYEGKAGVNSQFSVVAGSVKSALDLVTEQLDTNTQSIIDIGSGNLVAMQTEIDTTQIGAGLETDGQYAADATTNYISAATSLKNADKLIDAQVKVNTDGLAQEVIDRATADTAIRTDFASVATTKGASLVGVEDSADNFTGTTVEAVLAELQTNLTTEISDLSLQAVYDTSIPIDGDVILKLTAGKAIKFLDNNDDTYFRIDPDGDNPINVAMSGPIAVSGDMSISGNLNVSGSVTEITSTVTNSDHMALTPEGTAAAIVVNPGAAFTGTTVIDIKAANNGPSVLSIDNVDSTVKVTKLTASNAAIFNGTSSFNNSVSVAAGQVVSFGANVLTNVAAGVVATDAINKGQLDTVQSELDVSQTGAGLEATGAYAADATTNYISAATSLKNADKLIDAQVKVNTDGLAQEVIDRTSAVAAVRTDINALNYTTTTVTPALTHAITHSLNATYVDYTVLVEGDDGKFRNDIVAVTETDSNTITVELTEARNIKIAVKKVASI